MRRFSWSTGAGALLAIVTASDDGAAAERWIDRPMTLHRMVFAGDVGLGLGHADQGPGYTGVGMNLEGSFGILDSLEVGLRTGLRFGDGGKVSQADAYGRTLTTETWGTNVSTGANPELRVRWVAYSGSVAEIGLDGRMYLPLETNANFGLMFGVPLAFHVTDFLRIDTGAYTPVVFNDPAFSAFSFPAYFWFQPTERLWLGPMTALRFIDPGPGGYDAHLLLGFGLGYQVAGSVDIKTMLLLPAVDDNFADRVGAGVGVQFRIGD